jgi:hypothetical protein
MATSKPKPPTGAEAARILRQQVSPAGVKKKAIADKKAIDKKYPGLYKKSTSPKKFN